MRRNALEWAILAVSLAAILGVVGFLLFEAISDGGRPAQVAATADSSRAEDTAGGWLVPIRVYNDGGSAAIGIVVEVTATVGGVEEVSQLTVDVLAGGSEVELRAGFSDPPDGAVAVRIVGLETP